MHYKVRSRIPTYRQFHPPERFCGEFRHERRPETVGGTAVANSILRYPRSTSVLVFAGVTRGVEYGLIAAGITVAVLAVIQSCGVILGWFHSA
jgi:hypothetical protein